MQTQKKSRTLPHASTRGSDQEPDSKTIEKRPAETETQCSCWYFVLGIKRLIANLVGFRVLLIEIRLK